MELTTHASKRGQQRGIAYMLMDLLYQFGSVQYHRGTEIYSMNRSAVETFKTEVSLSAQLLERLLSIYMVMKDDLVITVAHKTVRHKGKRR
ncbi:hypothetical protein [Endozoicomonas lisbonensis]|uniref:N-acetyltransferase domain-containing protein n=1 Tax=Endozoicomonas lisbonensis TaxID=3120522 RepID=A0ABV2SL64_9GAMM